MTKTNNNVLQPTRYKCHLACITDFKVSTTNEIYYQLETYVLRNAKRHL